MRAARVNRRGSLRLIAGCVAAASCLGRSAAQTDEWPSRPVKIVIPFGPGGTSDRFGRLVATELSKSFKQQFYVENKPGAAGATASAEVARAQPDGYTLVLAGMGPHITGPALNPKIGYDPLAHFTHIAMVAGDSTLFAVHPALGIKTLPEFVKFAKSGVNYRLRLAGRRHYWSPEPRAIPSQGRRHECHARSLSGRRPARDSTCSAITFPQRSLRQHRASGRCALAAYCRLR